MTGDTITVEMSHLGIGVSDLDRSQRFYCELFGFRPAARLAGGKESAALVGLGDEARFESQFLVKGGLLIELVRFHHPAPRPAPELRPMNLAGLTHLSFRLTHGLDALLARVPEYGGTVLAETRTPTPFADGTVGTCIFCRDPDGTRVEIMEFADHIRFDTVDGARLA